MTATGAVPAVGVLPVLPADGAYQRPFRGRGWQTGHV